MNSLIEFFKVASEEMRFRIIMLLSRRTLCGCQLCEILELSQPKVSQHLGKLRDLGLVADNRQGKWVFYRLTMEEPVLQKFIQSVMENINQYPGLAQDMQRLMAIKECE